MKLSNTNHINKTAKNEFKINYIFKKDGMSFMKCIEKNFKRYIENIK